MVAEIATDREMTRMCHCIVNKIVAWTNEVNKADDDIMAELRKDTVPETVVVRKSV
jgi:hypothetical protein